MTPAVDWTGSAQYDLDVPARVVDYYRTVLIEATKPTDLHDYLDRATHVTPHNIRRMNPRHRRLAEIALMAAGEPIRPVLLEIGPVLHPDVRGMAAGVARERVIRRLGSRGFGRRGSGLAGRGGGRG